MAIDSENKRRSVFRFPMVIPPVPDGTIAGVDKQHVAGFYSGIPAASPTIGTVGRLVYGGLVNTGLVGGRLTG